MQFLSFNLTVSYILEFGSQDNQDLADKYGAKRENYPVYKLFNRNPEKSVEFQGNKESLDDILRFLVTETSKSCKC